MLADHRLGGVRRSVARPPASGGSRRWCVGRTVFVTAVMRDGHVEAQPAGPAVHASEAIQISHLE